MDALSPSDPFRRQKEFSILPQRYILAPKTKQTKQKKADEEDKEESDCKEHFPDSSQVASLTSKGWVTSHSTMFNQKLCSGPCY